MCQVQLTFINPYRACARGL